jgi:hypothetical protein
MPEIKSLDIKAYEIRKNDLLDDVLNRDAVTVGKKVLGHGHAVTAIKRGTTKITLETTGGRIILVEGQIVQVRREVATEVEKAADQLRFAQSQAVQLVTKYRQEDFVGELHAEIDKRAEWTEMFDWSSLANVLQKQAMRKIGFELTHISSRLFETEEITDEARAFEIVATWYAQEVLDTERRRYSVHDPLSRSTSVLANVLGDLDVWARASFVKDCA